jgi:hypothetical protein
MRLLARAIFPRKFNCLPYPSQKQSQKRRLNEKNNPFLGVCFPNQFLCTRPKTVKRPTKPLKNSQNPEEKAFYSLIPAYFSHFSELPLFVW